MKYFSHRGNLAGSNHERENSPVYIDEAIKAGYDVEIDLRMLGRDFYLGHDFPQFHVERIWIEERKYRLLLHVKSLSGLPLLNSDWHFFCHASDPFVLTSLGFVWLHDLSQASYKGCIVPLLSQAHIGSCNQKDMYGVCSDFVAECKQKFCP